MEDILIELKNLSKQFPSSNPNVSPLYALKNIDLKIPRGSIYGIIGMSGAGKSTLLRCLTGLEIPSEGTITFEGIEFPYDEAKNLIRLRQQIGMVFQHFQLFSSRSVAANIAYPLEIAKIAAAQQKQRIDELLALVDLESKKEHYPSQLSGGQKQRVGIARALASNPRLLLCDEPTSALDPKTTRDLLQLLYQLNQQLGLTIIMITHQLETVKQICQHVAVLANGEIVEKGEAKDIFTRPQHPVTQHLLHLSADQVPSNLLKQRQPNHYLVKLGFQGSQAKQPILSHLLKRYDIEANILSGGLDYLQETMIGHLFLELSGESKEIERALVFLRSKQVICEVFS